MYLLHVSITAFGFDYIRKHSILPSKRLLNTDNERVPVVTSELTE